MRTSESADIDLGCGPGHPGHVLRARWPGATVVGADDSDEMITRARADARRGPSAAALTSRQRRSLSTAPWVPTPRPNASGRTSRHRGRRRRAERRRTSRPAPTGHR
ncbi:methyltransferase domain-containing protein [Cellulomonas sp. APG4]|nr:methyltransferase domain-containing protein [Cellulomonas sp. APG4]